MKTLYQMSNDELINELTLFLILQEHGKFDKEMYISITSEIRRRMEGNA